LFYNDPILNIIIVKKLILLKNSIFIHTFFANFV